MKKSISRKISSIFLILSLLFLCSYPVIATLGSPPVFSSPDPSNSETGVSVTKSQVSIYISDEDKDGYSNELDWSIEVSTGDSSSGTGESSGTKTCSLTTPLDYGTTYTWYVNATTDSQGTAKGPRNESYTFTTEENQPPTITYVRVYNSTLSTHESLNSTNVSILPTWFNVSISDPDGDNMDITLRSNESGTWQDVNTSSTLSDGVHSFTNISWVDTWDTWYWVSVNLTDGTAWTNETFNFLTRTTPILSSPNRSPDGGIAGATFDFNVTVTDLDNDTQSVYGEIKASGGGAVLRNNTMSWSSGDNNTGALYEVSDTINTIGTYVCEFKSYDGLTWTTLSSSSFSVTTNTSFQLNFPSYLEVGQYIHADGTLKNSTGDPATGIWATTIILNSTWSEISNISKYITNGDYRYTYSTSTMIPGIYHIVVNFTSGGTEYTANHTLYLSDDSGSGHYTADVFFTFYNYNTGTGLDSNSFKIYISDETPLTASDRLYGNIYHDTYTGDSLYYRVDDYYNNQIYPLVGSYETINVLSTEEFEDVPVDWNSFSVKNMKHHIVYFKLTNGSTTYSQYLYPSEPFYWNVLDGDYTINLTYYSTEDNSIVGYHEETMSITEDAYYWITGYDIRDVFIQGEELKNRSTVLFNFYNTNEGLGLDKATLKVYVNGTRITEDRFFLEEGDSRKINVTVKDYYNTTLFQQNFTINNAFRFLDLGLTFHSWLFGNKNDDYYMISLLKENASRWWERGIVPNGEREFMIPSGNYTLRIYDKDYDEIYNDSHTVNRSMVYLIQGTNLEEIIAGQSVIRGQLLELASNFRPDIVSVGTDLPHIYSIFDIQGCPNTENITEVCPPQVLMATSITTYDANSTINASIPTNDTTNGSIYTLSDILTFEGPSATTWVNVSYTNGTVIQNTSYIPNKLDLGKLGHRLSVVVNASHNISISRETRFQQVQEFYWTKYLDQQKYQATVHFENALDQVIWDPYLIITFADDETPDYKSVVVEDVANDYAELERGDRFGVTSGSIQLRLNLITAGSNRSYKCTYYVSAETIQPSDAIISVEIPDRTVEHNDELYYYMDAQWLNDREKVFIGTVNIKFDFTIEPGMIDQSTIEIYDEIENSYLSGNDWVYTGSAIIIGQEAVGTVQPQSTRQYTIYYQSVKGGSEEEYTDFLDTSFAGPILWIHVIDVFILFIGGLSIFISKQKELKNRLYIFYLCLLVLFFLNMYYLM